LNGFEQNKRGGVVKPYPSILRELAVIARSSHGSGLVGARLITSDRVFSRYHFTEMNKSGNAGRQHVLESFKVVKRYGPLRGLLADVFMALYGLFDLQAVTTARRRARA